MFCSFTHCFHLQIGKELVWLKTNPFPFVNTSVLTYFEKHYAEVSVSQPWMCIRITWTIKKKSQQRQDPPQMDMLKILGYFTQAFIVWKSFPGDSKCTTKAVDVMLGTAIDRCCGRVHSDFVCDRQVDCYCYLPGVLWLIVATTSANQLLQPTCLPKMNTFSLHTT